MQNSNQSESSWRHGGTRTHASTPEPPLPVTRHLTNNLAHTADCYAAPDSSQQFSLWQGFSKTFGRTSSTSPHFLRRSGTRGTRPSEPTEGSGLIGRRRLPLSHSRNLLQAC